MRWMLYLLSFYMLLLAGIPCNADGCCDEEGGAIGAQSGQAHGEQPAKKAPCPCSPFFSCCSCHGVVIPDGPLLPAIVAPIGKSICFFYSADILPDFAASIWQPPQLV